ncbi:hypothetical protein D3C71_1506970 [compost metagenome]
MPECARTASAGLEEHFLGEIPDVFGTPEVCEQLAKGEGRHQRLQALFGERIGVVDVRLLQGPIEHSKRVGAVVLDCPVIGSPTLS